MGLVRQGKSGICAVYDGVTNAREYVETLGLPDGTRPLILLRGGGEGREGGTDGYSALLAVGRGGGPGGKGVRLRRRRWWRERTRGQL